MLILGLDLSTKPGWAVIDSTEGIQTLVAYGTVFGIKDSLIADPLWDVVPYYRSIDIANKVAQDVFKIYCSYQPDLIVIENTNGSKFRQSQKMLEWIHQSVLTTMRFVGKKIVYVDTSAWRSLIGLKLSKQQKEHNKRVKNKLAKGKLTWKHLSVDYVNKKHSLNLLLKDNDSADAIILAECGIILHKNMNSYGKLNVEKALS